MAQDDEVLIDADDINREAMENMWSFSPTAEETAEIHAADTGQKPPLSLAKIFCRYLELDGSLLPLLPKTIN